MTRATTPVSLSAVRTESEAGSAGSDTPTSWHGLEDLRPVVVRYLLRRCRDESEADDLAQETLVRAARYRHRQRDHLRPWLVQIAANVFRDHVGRVRRGPAFTGDDLLLESAAQGPEIATAPVDPGETIDVDGEAVDEELLLRDLRAAVEELRASDRAVITGYYGAGLSTAALAGRCGISPSLVKVRLFRVRRRLERTLRERASRRRTRRLWECVG